MITRQNKWSACDVTQGVYERTVRVIVAGARLITLPLCGGLQCPRVEFILMRCCLGFRLEDFNCKLADGLFEAL